MPLFIKITTPKVWAQGDYTSDSALDINATVYTDQQFTTVKDLTGYTTITMRIIDPNHNGALLWDSTQGVSGDANGILTWAPPQGSAPHLKGTVKLRPRFEKSGEKMTGIGVNASDEIYFRKD